MESSKIFILQTIRRVLKDGKVEKQRYEQIWGHL